MNTLLIISAMAALTVIGFIFIVETGAQAAGNPLFENPTITSGNTPRLAPMVDGKQDIYLKATQYGTYSPSKLKIKQGIPVRIHFSADSGAGCGHALLIPEYNIQTNAPAKGEVLIEFTPARTGRFPFHCSMKMFNGTIEVVA